ncbi:hypothetical protein NOVOSPHI9U_70099 [Novosphingobium sp. 9U]|nr:hypothetical protein NOVOSPHI9U_70099 [Novosphingobium sp. 9U]
MGRQGDLPHDGGRAGCKAGQEAEQCGERRREAKRSQDHEQGRRRKRCGDVKLVTQQDRGYARGNVADHASQARGDHARRNRRDRPDPELQRLASAVNRVGGEAHGIEPIERPLGPPLERDRPGRQCHAEAQQHRRGILHPEHRGADEKVAQGAAPGRGDQREETPAHEVQSLAHRRQRARGSEDRESGKIQPRKQDLDLRSLERKGGQHGSHVLRLDRGLAGVTGVSRREVDTGGGEAETLDRLWAASQPHERALGRGSRPCRTAPHRSPWPSCSR